MVTLTTPFPDTASHFFAPPEAEAVTQASARQGPLRVSPPVHRQVRGQHRASLNGAPSAGVWVRAKALQVLRNARDPQAGGQGARLWSHPTRGTWASHGASWSPVPSLCNASLGQEFLTFALLQHISRTGMWHYQIMGDGLLWTKLCPPTNPCWIPNPQYLEMGTLEGP